MVVGGNTLKYALAVFPQKNIGTGSIFVQRVQRNQYEIIILYCRWITIYFRRYYKMIPIKIQIPVNSEQRCRRAVYIR